MLVPKKCDDSLLNLFNIIQHQAIVWVIMFQDVAWVMGRSVLIWIIWQIHRAVVSFAEKNASRLMPRVNHHVQKKGFGLSDRHGGPNCLFFSKTRSRSWHPCCPEQYMARSSHNSLKYHHVLPRNFIRAMLFLRMEQDEQVLHASHSWFQHFPCISALKPWLSNSVVDVNHFFCSSQGGESHDISYAIQHLKAKCIQRI